MFGFLLIFFLTIYSKGFSLEENYILFDKALYKLEVRNGERVIYQFEAGFGLKSPLYKTRKGDFLTPEGIYKIRTIRPSQNYFYFVELSYPNENDISWAYYRGELKAENLSSSTHLEMK